MLTDTSLTRVASVSSVFEAVNRAKTGAADFCTNFFPVENRLRGWIEHEDLSAFEAEGAAFFFRRDRGLQHLYFAAASPIALSAALRSCDPARERSLVLDLVGPEPSLTALAGVFEQQGWRRYRRLVRLARLAADPGPAATAGAPVTLAAPGDSKAVLKLIEDSFDRYADQIPPEYEMEQAVAGGQVLVARVEGEIGALLHFETQGFTSTIRYWVVAPQYRDRKLGSALIRYYFLSQPAVRRFILWVTADNDDAVRKYAHYGYGPDRLADLVFVSPAIAHEIATRNSQGNPA